MSWQSGAIELPKRLFDAFLLRGPETRVRTRTLAQTETITRYHAAASKRIQVARTLHAPTEAVAAITLYREAAVLLIAAMVQANEAGDTPLPRSPEEAWRAFDACPVPAGRAPSPESLARARELLSKGDPLSADELSPPDLLSATAAAAETVKWLTSVVEPRTLYEIKVDRWIRIAVVSLLVVYGVFKVVMPKNLALHQPASASSQAFDATLPSGFTNGDLESTFGIHTRTEANPWVQVDLGATETLHEVRVFNRAEAIYQIDILPLILELSDDGRVFVDVARRDELFTQDKPWIVKLKGRRARYVRVLEDRSPGYIALSEIEVY